MLNDQDHLMKRALSKCIQKNEGNPIARVLKSPVRLPLSKIAEKFCLFTGLTMPLSAQTFWGERMRVEFPEIVSCFLYRYGYFEPDLTKLVMKYVKPDDVFIDIGTHFGYYSLLASKLVGKGGQVHSFEPTANTYKVVFSNLSQKTNVTLNNLAVWSESTSLLFKDYGNTLSAFNSLYSAKLDESTLKGLKPIEYNVNTTTIDEYVSKLNLKPNFIKIDAENAEYDILTGMKHTLEKIRPIITLEVGDVNKGEFKSSAEAVQFLMGYGYLAYELKQDELVKHIPSEVYQHTNLIFLPS